MDQPSDGFPFERIAAACREQMLREKILVVPSLAIGHQIADRIAHEGTAWVNLRPETIRTLADAVTGEGLAAEGITVLSRAQALALVEAACAEALGGGYFGELAERPGLHRAMQRSIDDLRLAGVTAETLDVAAFEDARKGEDLRRILSAYERELEAGRFIDRCGVLARATGVLEGGAKRPWVHDALWLIVEDDDLSDIEERFLAAVVGDGERTRLDIHPAATGDRAPAGRPYGRGHSFRFVSAVGEENEIRAALRALLADGASFDDAELVYTSRDPYLALAYEITSEHGVEATFAEGIAVHFTRPGRAAVGLLRWMESWEDVYLRRIALSGALDVESDSDDVPLSGPAFARNLREASIGWTRERHLPRLDALAAEQLREAVNPEKDEAQREALLARAARIRRTRAIVAELLDGAPDGEEISVATMADELASLVDARAAIRSEIDGMAKSGICRMLRELGALPGEPLPRAEVCARLRDAILALHVGASNPRPGLLHVAPIRAAGWSGRRRLFVAGLEESRHPGSGIQDPVLLDAERARLNTTIDPRQLPLLADRPRRTARSLERMLGRVSPGATITLSWPSLDVRERRERFPAQALLEIWREAEGKPAAGYEELERSVPRAGFLPDPVPLSMSEWWTGRSAPPADVLASYPLLAAGEHAEEERASAAITSWDGKVDAPRDELDPRELAKVYSASQLESMAKCPYSYFLSRILGLDPLAELERGDDWLSPMEYGSVYHEVLERFMREMCERGFKPSRAHEERLAAIATEVLEAMAEEVPPPGEGAYQARVEEMIEATKVFLRAEERDCGDIDAKEFEVAFGYPEGEGLSMTEPLELRFPSGESIRVRGRIDRVDHHPATNAWHVWDYKSGSTWGFDRGGSLAAGMKVQHAIYTKALEAMLKRAGIDGKVTRSGYYFPTVKGRGWRNARSSAPGALERALGLLFDVVGRGYFPHAPADRCTFCDFSDVCGGAEAAAARAEAKHAANIDDPAVRAWVELQGVV